MSVVLQSAVQKDVEKLIIKFRNETTREISHIFQAMGEKDPDLKAFTLGTQLDGIGFNMVGASESYPIDEIEEYLIKTYCSPRNKRKKK